MRDNRYKTRSDMLSDAVIGAKRLALTDESRKDRRFYFAKGRKTQRKQR